MRRDVMKTVKLLILLNLMFLSFFIFSCSKSESIYSENFETQGVNISPSCGFDILAYENGMLYAAGWGADPEDGAPVKRVRIYIDNKLLGEPKLGIERPDVASSLNRPNWSKSGWEMRVKTPLSKGKHTASVVVYDKMEAFIRMGDKELVVE